MYYNHTPRKHLTFKYTNKENIDFDLFVIFILYIFIHKVYYKDMINVDMNNNDMCVYLYRYICVKKKP